MSTPKKFTPKATVFFIITTLGLIIGVVGWYQSERSGVSIDFANNWTAAAIIGGAVFLIGYVLWFTGAISLHEKE